MILLTARENDYWYYCPTNFDFCQTKSEKFKFNENWLYLIFGFFRDNPGESLHNNKAMTDLPDGFKNLQEAMPSQSDIRNYKTSATQEQVLRTLGEMKKSFIQDGMSDDEADRRVSMMLEAYGIATQVFKDYFIKNNESL